MVDLIFIVKIPFEPDDIVTQNDIDALGRAHRGEPSFIKVNIDKPGTVITPINPSLNRKLVGKDLYAPLWEAVREIEGRMK